MKILYGLCGEGFGHSSRAGVVGDYLTAAGHELKMITYGQALDVLKDRFDIIPVEGLHLIFKDSVLSKTRTLAYNAKHFPKNLARWKEFRQLMADFEPDVCVSDMEPIVPVLSNHYDRPLICFDNQHRLTNLQLQVPPQYRSSYLLAKGTTNAFVRKADYFIITSFTDTPVRQHDRANTIVVPPIIRDAVKTIVPTVGSTILVYLTKPDDTILKTLSSIPHEFVVYGYNRLESRGNCHLKCRDTFLDDLAACRAIIATAGFTLISEALYLSKPYLAVPLAGQFEQTLNALFLKDAGFGDFTEQLTVEVIASFLDRLETFGQTLGGYRPDYDALYRAWDTVLEAISRNA